MDMMLLMILIQEFRIEKVIKKKRNKLYANGKDMIIHLIAVLIKETWYK